MSDKTPNRKKSSRCSDHVEETLNTLRKWTGSGESTREPSPIYERKLISHKVTRK